MPEQVAGQPTPETPAWSQEAVEQQATEADKTPETPETPEPQAQEAKPEVHKVVPLTALHEERNRRKEANQRAQYLEQQNQALQRQMQDFMARQQQPEKLPDPNDPLGVMQHGIQKTQNELAQMRQQREQEQQQQLQMSQRQQFINAVKAQEAEFVTRQPDANDGITHWKKSLVAEYEAAGLSRHEAVQRLHQEELQLSWEALQRGDNPAEVAYNRSLSRGYVPAAKKLEMQKQGQGASMPSGSGGKSGGLPSLEALLKMGSSEFTKATAGDNWAKLVNK